MSTIAGIRSSTKRQLALMAMLFLGIYGLIGGLGYATISESLIAFMISIISTYMGYSIKEESDYKKSGE